VIRYAWWWLKGTAFRFFRPLFVPDYDWREDFNCVVCGNPVLYRHLCCSQRCADELEEMKP
jgi:hypothetical protein